MGAHMAGTREIESGRRLVNRLTMGFSLTGEVQGAKLFHLRRIRTKP
ncbi:hypothetical protein SAMN04488112_12616 [Melghirimyces thermohalophilus]|uniref:Uncharacterized protein n=1 Tax=Melghirimyces thermohalophilus TaxID=1236220 RepID=A0A1G6R5P4_9BACL|nr:hypothetical protein SAMN04488112_12616 [Melghirimyces thermohalophilus]